MKLNTTLDALEKLDTNNVKVYTTNSDLINKIKVLEDNRGNGNVMANNIVFVSDNLKINKYEKNMFYIEFLDNNFSDKSNVFDSYVSCNDNKDAIVDLLNALYAKEYISIEACDLMHIMKDKTFSYFTYIIEEPIKQIDFYKYLDKIIDNKNAILVFYGNEKNLNYTVNKVNEFLKNRNGVCLYSYCKNDKDKISIFVEQ